MRFSVFTASTPEWTPEQAATTLAQQGWDGIEWRIVDQADNGQPGFWSGNRSTIPFTGVLDRIDEVAALMRRTGLAYSGIGGYQPVGDRDAVLTMLRLTAALGAERVRVVMPATGSDRPYPEVFRATREDLAWVADRAGEFGVQALVEVHQDTITPSASAALRLVDGLDPRHVGVIHDLGNLVVEGFEHLRSGLEMLGPYLAHVHVKNARWAPTGTKRPDGSDDWASEWAPMTTGVAPVAEYLATLTDLGYDGWVTVEDFSTELPLAERTAGNLAYLRSVTEPHHQNDATRLHHPR
ncbi:sugar phosphate isomerase/epimerase [Curtobacterium flaccumfaciens]|nr:sugar phosphate isomerase/epimerase [Curtobacterium flaccumfaciens]